MAPESSKSDSSAKRFDLIATVQANGKIPVHKYKSKTTDLTVILAEVEGPVVNGYYCVATEALDDDGLPHTLEHLIFLGSEDYPYKGVLDLLANRCMASGTNAWTDVDHTCYTITTAGNEGFLSLLPIYLDHILNPTLTESAYVTEVHHVNGDGEDAGVVYSEMQSRENTGERITNLAVQRALYPGKCGYKSETGGILQNFRDSTSNKKVRAYHHQFYRAENLCLIITGQVTPDEVFKALKPVEEKIMKKQRNEPFFRPWQSVVPVLDKAVTLKLPYPCDEEDHGIVLVAWRGPSATTEFEKVIALNMLLEYLTETSVSPLQQEFVENDDPYASMVAVAFMENSETAFCLHFASVPCDKLDKVSDKLVKVLNDIVEKKDIDMKRMDSVIHRKTLEQLSNIENSPHDSIAFMAIGDFLYGHDINHMNLHFDPVSFYTKLHNEDASFWINLLKKYILDKPVVSVVGIPSCAEAIKQTEEEGKRIKEQQRTLQKDGLELKGKILQEAMENNEKPPPAGTVTSVPIPSISSIQFHPIETYRSDDPTKTHDRFSIDTFPYYLQLDDAHSNFIYITAVLDTSNIPTSQRLYLPLLLEALFESPIERDGKIIPYETVVTELAEDTLQQGAKLGFDIGGRFSCGAYSQSMIFALQGERDKYEKIVRWFYELLYKSKFTSERLKVIATKMINDVSRLRRKGNKLSYILMKDMCYTENSNYHANSMLRQLIFLNQLCEKLDKTPDVVVEEMDNLRKSLTNPDGMMIQLATQITKLADSLSINPVTPWCDIANEFNIPKSNKKRFTVIPDHSVTVPVSTAEFRSVLVGLGCVESSFLVQTVDSINDYHSPDLPALMVCVQYLSQTEGPLWRQIRGLGLAYDYNLYIRPNEGLLYFSLYGASHTVAAYKEFQSIVASHINGTETWQDTLLASAKSSLIFELIENEKSVGDMIGESLLSFFKQVDRQFYRKLLIRVSDVTIDNIRVVGNKYLTPLFDENVSRCSIVCHPAKIGEIVEGLKEYRGEIKVCPSLEDCFLSK